jgi:hypothetical protein
VKFCVHDHQMKSRLLVATLLEAGHELSPVSEADLLLVDIDDPDAPGRGDLITACPGTIVLYPHGALPTYHGYYQPDRRVDVQLVHGPGSAALVSNLGLGRDVRPVGWSYSPTASYKAPQRPRRVLFGPVHPYGSGALDERNADENRRVLQALRALDVELTVQMFGTPQMNGFLVPPDARIVYSTLNVDWTEVDQADLVVAEGTLACLALARGKPVVMIGQFPTSDENGRSPVGPVVKVPRYPIDCSAGLLPDLFTAACADEGGWWREQYVGGPFDSVAFLNSVETLVAA